MALSEAEELELLELENENAAVTNQSQTTQPAPTTQPQQPGIYPATIREEGLIPQGPVSSITGPLAGLLGKLGEMGATSENTLGQIAGFPAFVASENLPTSEAGAAAQYFGVNIPLGKLGQTVKLPKSGKEAQTLAQSYRSLGAIPERTTQAVLKRIEQGFNPLTKAKPLEEATANYVKSIPGLKNVTESLHESLGKSVPTLGDYGKFLDETIAKAGEGTANPQDILNGIQATNKILGHKEFAKDPDIVRGLLQRKNNLIDLLDQAFPNFKQANQALRDAHLRNEFDTFFPRNKNMSVNQLRGFLTTASNIATGTAAALTGNVAPLAGSMALTATQSPKVLGGLLSARATLGQEIALPSLYGLAAKGAKGTGKSLAKIMKSESGALFPKGEFENFANKPTFEALRKTIENSSKEQLESRIEGISKAIEDASEARLKAGEQFGRGSPEDLAAAKFHHDLINRWMPEYSLSIDKLNKLGKIK